MHESVKEIIKEYCKDSFHNVQPIIVYNWQNLESTRQTKMIGLPQPKLHQIQYFIKKLRIESGATQAKNDTQSLIELMNMWKYDTNKKEESAFFFGYETNKDGEIVLDDINNFRVALSSKRLLYNLNSF